MSLKERLKSYPIRDMPRRPCMDILQYVPCGTSNLRDAITRTFEMMYQLGHSVDVLARILHEMYGMGRPKDTYFWFGTFGRELYQIGTSLGCCVLLGMLASSGED